jgi:hypothetical protein
VTARHVGTVAQLVDLIAHVAREDRLRSIASTAENAPLGKNDNDNEVRLLFSRATADRI